MKIVPVVAFEKLDDVKKVMDELLAGGLNCIEVTFRTAVAAEAISIISKNYKDVLVGAGTVLNCNQVDEAIQNGAKFIVSPGINKEVVRYCQNKKMTVIPGCATPTEIEIAINLNLEVVKFFPAVALGGVSMLKALAAPYNKIKFMPTGGINKDNIDEFLKLKNVIACGGSWMVTNEMIKNGEFDKIRKLSFEITQHINKEYR